MTAEPIEPHPADGAVAPLAALTPDPRNAHRHDDRDFTLIEAALREVGAAGGARRAQDATECHRT